jgi:hypothetical protein
MVKKPNCYESFRAGQASRANCPLRLGEYKLAECLYELSRWYKDISAIRNLVSGKFHQQQLTCCTTDDKSVWLKKLPLDVAYWLGYKLLPGLKALVNDGADRAYVDSVSVYIEKDCLELLDRMEEVRLAIKKNIALEYEHMKLGGSLLEPLVDDAIFITERALGVLTDGRLVNRSNG